MTLQSQQSSHMEESKECVPFQTRHLSTGNGGTHPSWKNCTNKPWVPLTFPLVLIMASQTVWCQICVLVNKFLAPRQTFRQQICMKIYWLKLCFRMWWQHFLRWHARTPRLWTVWGWIMYVKSVVFYPYVYLFPFARGWVAVAAITIVYNKYE